MKQSENSFIVPQLQIYHNLTARYFENKNWVNSLRAAQEYVGTDGYVLSLPQLALVRINAIRENPIWTSEEVFTTTEEAYGKTKQGHDVVIVTHGGGILYSKVLMDDGKKTASFKQDRLGVKITRKDITDLLDGRLPDGTYIPVISYSDLQSNELDESGKNRELPPKFAIVMDADS